MQGMGTTFGRHDGTAFATVARILEIGDVSLSRDASDTTTFDSTGGYRQFEASGLRDAGETQLTLVWDPADTEHAALRGDFDSATAEQYQITWPDGSSYTCDGLVTAYGVSTPLEDRVTAQVTVKWTGQPVWA